MLDTRSGSAAVASYRGKGWTVLAEAQGFALDPYGRMAACTFFYEHLAA